MGKLMKPALLSSLLSALEEERYSPRFDIQTKEKIIERFQGLLEVGTAASMSSTAPSEACCMPTPEIVNECMLL